MIASGSRRSQVSRQTIIVRKIVNECPGPTLDGGWPLIIGYRRQLRLLESIECRVGEASFACFRDLRKMSAPLPVNTNTTGVVPMLIKSFLIANGYQREPCIREFQ